MRVETPTAAAAGDPVRWLRDRVEALCADGAQGRLFIFLRQPPDEVVAAALRWIVADHRLEPAIVAESTALRTRAHLELLQQTGVRAFYVTLHGATAESHDARTGTPGSWKRALVVLTTAPQLLERVRLGVHLLLSADSVAELPRILKLVGRLGDSELLLWDAGTGGLDAAGLDPAAALRALDFTVTAAAKQQVRVRPVGFERTRTLTVPSNATPCLLSATVATLLQDGIPLPSARTGVLAVDGQTATIAEAAPTGVAVSQMALVFAASGIPVLDLPACLGGPPPECASARADGIKVEACRRCPIDSRCGGLPAPLTTIPGIHDEVRPPLHWMAVPEQPRVLVWCPVVTEEVYGTTFFSLARALTRLGAEVDLLTPWDLHAGSSAPDRQPLGQPEGRSAIETFIVEGPVERYDLIVTPDPLVTHPLVVNGRLRSDTRLAVTDFHMLGGMKNWVGDLCAPGQRPEEGGWWPSEQIMLYSAFPGFAPLYTRYGVPLRQVAWQPYALDPAAFPIERPATEGTSIISAGHHRRDLATLFAAAARLSPAVYPIDLLAPGDVPSVPRQIRFHGTVPTSAFCSFVSRSRFMVVPLLEDARNAAGITAMVTAIIYSRPIVATASPSSRDYVTDGFNGLLVPPGNPRALAEAIERLDTDPALLATLAAGAGEAASQLTTDAWARALLQGSHTYDAAHWMWTKWGLRPATL